MLPGAPNRGILRASSNGGPGSGVTEGADQPMVMQDDTFCSEFPTNAFHCFTRRDCGVWPGAGRGSGSRRSANWGGRTARFGPGYVAAATVPGPGDPPDVAG